MSVCLSVRLFYLSDMLYIFHTATSNQGCCVGKWGLSQVLASWGRTVPTQKLHLHLARSEPCVSIAQGLGLARLSFPCTFFALAVKAKS